MTALKSVIVALSAANFVIGMGAFVVVGMVTPIGTDLKVGPEGAGAILTSYALAYAVLSPLLVSVTGQIGRRRIMAAGLVVFACAALASALAPSMAWLHAARIMAAAGAGVVTPVAAAVAAGLVPEAGRARALASVFFGLTLAQVVGVPAGSFLAYEVGWRATFVVVAALAFPCALLIWTQVPAGLAFQTARLHDLGAVLIQRAMMTTVLFTASFLAAIYIVFTYLAPLLETRMAFTGQSVSITLLMFGLGAVAGNIIGGRASDRFGPYRTLLCLCGGQVICLPVLSLLPIAPMLWWPFVLCWSAIGWSFVAGQQVRLISLDPSRAGVLLALNAAAIYMGAALGSALGSGVIAVLGLDMLGYAAALCMVGAIANLVASERLAIRTAPAPTPPERVGPCDWR